MNAVGHDVADYNEGEKRADNTQVRVSQDCHEVPEPISTLHARVNRGAKPNDVYFPLLNRKAPPFPQRKRGFEPLI